VTRHLQADGYHVISPQFRCHHSRPDVARLREVLRFQTGPTLIVGHSYGGQIMTALATDAPNAVGLIYIAAFAFDEGESLGALLSQGPVTPHWSTCSPTNWANTWLSEDDFVNPLRRDVEPDRARVLHAAQQALAGGGIQRCHGSASLEGTAQLDLVASNDEAIPPDAEATIRRTHERDVEIPSTTSRWCRTRPTSRI